MQNLLSSLTQPLPIPSVLQTHYPELGNSLRSIAQNAGETALIVADTLTKGNIRALLITDTEKVIALITLQLEHCALHYAGAKNDSISYEELTRFVIDQYAHIGPNEITHAFQLAAAGKLGDLDIKAYYGTFTGISLGAILNRYDDYRKKEVLARFKEQNDRLEREREKFSQDEVDRKNREAKESRTNWLLAQPSLTIDKVFERDFYYLKEAGLLDFSRSDYFDIFQIAKVRFKEINDLDLQSTSFITRMSAKSNLALTGADLTSAIQLLARKLAVIKFVERRQLVEYEPVS